jgi:hypothetical protein
MPATLTPTCNSCDVVITKELEPITAFGKKAGYCWPCSKEAQEATARAAGQDAGNRAMRTAGRSRWSRADYNAAVREFNRLHPEA